LSEYEDAQSTTTENFQSTCRKFFDADLNEKNKIVSCDIPPRGYIGNQGTQMYGHSIHRETYCYGPESFKTKKTLSHAPNQIPGFISPG